jgi:predicted phage-related endonuclease
MDANERFLERRLTGVGASDAPIVVGLGYISAAELWEQKTRRREPDPESEEMRIGTLLEPVISKLAEEKLAALLGKPVRLSARNRFRRRRGSEWQFCHVDRTLDGIPVELKAPQHTYGEWGDEGEGERGVAMRYRPQVQHQIAVLDVPYAYVVAFMPARKDPVRLYRVDRNDEQIEALDAAESDFWQHVLDDEPVEADGSESGQRFLRRRYPVDDGTSLVATAEQRLIVEQLLDANDARKAATKAYDDLKAKVAGWMKTAAELVGPNFEITYHTHEKRKIEWEEIAGAYRRVIEGAIEVADGSIDGVLDYSTTPGGKVGSIDRAGLDAIESMYSRVDKERRFLPSRKEGR